MNDNLDRLIQQEVDGVNSPEELAELNKAIEADAAVGTRLSEYRALAASVADLPMADAPSGFTDRVMAGLPSPVWAGRSSPGFAPDRDSRAASRGRSLTDWIFGPRLMPAYAFVAGVLLAVAATLSVVGPSPGSAGAAGTMGGAEAESAELFAFEQVSVAVTRSTDGMRLDVTIPEGARLALRSTNDLQAGSIDWPGLSSDAPESAITVGPQSVSVAGGLGSVAVEYLRAAPDVESGAVELRLFRGDAEVGQRTVPLRPSRPD